MTAWDDLRALEMGQEANAQLLSEVFRFDVTKALDPLRADDFDVIVSRLSTKVRAVALPEQGRALREALEMLDVDWKNLSDEARARVIEAAKKPFLELPARVMPKLEQGFRAENERVVRGTKKSTMLKYKLNIQASLSTLDQRVIEHASKSQGHFVRDEFGRRSEIFSARARQIVADHLEQGYGRADIAQALQDKLGPMGRNEGYWNIVASILSCRARAAAQVSSFSEAGIAAFLWDSIMDEATSVQCRFLHGKRFTVARALEVFTAIESSEDPEDIRTLNPFMQLGRDPLGNEALFVGRGENRRMAARVEENAVGRKNERGHFSGDMSAEALAKAGVVAPPAHGSCRSTIVPDDESLSVAVPSPTMPPRPPPPSLPSPPARPVVPPYAPAPTAAAPPSPPPPVAPPALPPGPPVLPPALAPTPARPRAARPRQTPAAPAPTSTAPVFVPAPASPGRRTRSRPTPTAPGKFEIGVHAKKFKSDLTPEELEHALDGVRRAGLLGFLKKKPLNELNFKKTLDSKTANGTYNGARRRLEVKSQRDRYTYGKDWVPGSSWSVSSAAKDPRTAIQRTFIHELGHHVHLSNTYLGGGGTVDDIIVAAFKKADGKALTQYSLTNHKEYFAEAFAAHVYEPEDLRRRDPIAFKMVEDVREHVKLDPVQP